MHQPESSRNLTSQFFIPASYSRLEGYWEVGAKLQMSGRGPDPKPVAFNGPSPEAALASSKISSRISGSWVSWYSRANANIENVFKGGVRETLLEWAGQELSPRNSN
jgi:hypothetical protein